MGPKYGLTLSSEEHEPQRLVDMAVAAEQAGFDFVSISDHFHPWLSTQGHSPFVWSVLGAISQVTDRIEVGVGVSCPIMRIHPAVHAQAVATAACLLDGRLTWGVGTGEALNEHVVGSAWPTAEVRLEMLEESVAVIRRLWSEESVTHRGKHFVVEDARIFDLPGSPPPVVVSAFGEDAARAAARFGDGLWTTGPPDEIAGFYRDAGGSGPVWTQLTVSWDESREAAVERAHRVWANTGLPGQMAQDLRTVKDFEDAVTLVTPAIIEEKLPCGPDLEPIIGGIKKAIAGGADYVYIHQIGDPLQGFLEVWRNGIQPAL
jgi:G6PDH family F420-dependent oxidoreductase